MEFCFYPDHQHGCPHVSHCPHLGGAALGTLVHAASDNEQYLRMLHGQLDFERKRNTKLFEENQELKQQVELLKLELNIERQKKFATNKQMGSESDSASEAKPSDASPSTARKRGAPVGHPGWYRPRPTYYDQLIEVEAPHRCPWCDAEVNIYWSQEPHDHLQEDVIDGQYHVTLYRHPVARCLGCRRWVNKPGEDEILGSRVGPHVRSMAVYLRNEIAISYRKVPQAIQEMFDFRFTAAALIDFEKTLAKLAEPLVEDIEKKIGSTDGAVHADETYWILDAERAYYWVHGTEKYIHFQFDTSRAGEVSRHVLGPYFEGTLVTDCYAGYEAHTARAKQKCLAHLVRTARDWQKLVAGDSQAYAYFTDVIAWVKRGCQLHRNRAQLSASDLAKEAKWLRKELKRLQACPLDHEKAVTLQERIKKHEDCWLVFLDDPRVPPTNNLAERALRPLVIMRKITFGHRSQSGAEGMANIMTIKETGKRHGCKPIDLFFRLYTRPPNRVLRYLYAGR